MIERKQVLALNAVQTASRNMRTFLAHRLHEYGLYAGQDRVILLLAQEDGQSPGVLSKKLGVKPPTITKTIARLQEQGFVYKSESKTDQRQLHVYLTETGREAVKQINAAVLETEREIFNGFNKQDTTRFFEMLVRVQSNLVRATTNKGHFVKTKSNERADCDENSDHL